jgi:hypothetical protein
MERFRSRMDAENTGWESATILGRINMFYLTGTMQDGLLLIPRDGEAVLWVRRSYERALDESCFPRIEPMESYRDAARESGILSDTVYLETELVPLAMLQRLQKHFPFSRVRPLDLQISRVGRKVLMNCHGWNRPVIHERVPGADFGSFEMSEAGLGSELYSVMVREGHFGIVRFGGMGIEIEVGHLGFGESSLYPTSFDGPGGSRGMGPAAPVLGSPERRLAKGDSSNRQWLYGRRLPDRQDHDLYVRRPDPGGSDRYPPPVLRPPE